MTPRTSRRALTTALIAGFLTASPPPASAHDIPVQVTVQSFVRPAAGTLRVLVRVPLAAMRDIQFPVRGPGYLDLARTGPLLEDAARLWVAGSLELREEDRILENPRKKR